MLADRLAPHMQELKCIVRCGLSCRSSSLLGVTARGLIGLLPSYPLIGHITRLDRRHVSAAVFSLLMSFVDNVRGGCLMSRHGGSMVAHFTCGSRVRVHPSHAGQMM
eukprot:3772433-Amphidinium_carterae.2